MRRLLLSFILICLLTVPASAHPGGTDGSGGHTDHDTGDYHYHHGHSAHDHYDMDGDGDPDCPYDFDDQTDRNSSTSSGVSSYSSSGTVYHDGYWEGYSDAEPVAYDRGYEDGYIAASAAGELTSRICAGAAWLGIMAFLVMCILLRSKKREIASLEQEVARFRSQAAQAKKFAPVPISRAEVTRFARKMGVDELTAIQMWNEDMKHKGKPTVFYDGSK